MDVTAMILCAGNATRMKEVCQSIPKCMLQIKEAPFIEWLIKWLLQQGISDIVITTGKLHQPIEKHFSKYSNIKYSKEKILLGTGGGVIQGANYATHENILVLNGDTLFKANIKSAFEKHLDNGAIATQILTKESNQNQGEILIDLTKKSVSEHSLETRNNNHKFSSTGAYLFSKKTIIKYFKKNGSLENDFIKEIINNNELNYYIEKKSKTYDFGTPERFQEIMNINIKRYYGL